MKQRWSGKLWVERCLCRRPRHGASCRHRPRSVRAVPHGGDGAAHRLAMTSEGVDAYGGEHVVSARTARAAPLSPVLPEDRPSLPLRQNSAARRLRRQTPRRRAGACIFSEHRRRTPNARTQETARAADSDAYSAVGRRHSDLLPGAGRCGRSRQKKKSKKIRKNVVTIDRP